VFIVAEHELGPALIDGVPLAGVKHRLEFIEARRRGGPTAVAIPGKPASAVQPQAQSVQGGQRDQADSQARDGHEEQHSHARLTYGAVWRVPSAASSAYRARQVRRDLATGGRVVGSQHRQPSRPVDSRTLTPHRVDGRYRVTVSSITLSNGVGQEERTRAAVTCLILT
jgi:hypothetical protein